MVTGTGEVDAEVAGAAGEVEHGAGPRQGEQAHGLAPPPHVEAEGHDPVDHVVPGSDRVEHLPNGCRLGSALREGLAVPGVTGGAVVGHRLQATAQEP